MVNKNAKKQVEAMKKKMQQQAEQQLKKAKKDADERKVMGSAQNHHAILKALQETFKLADVESEIDKSLSKFRGSFVQASGKQVKYR